MSFINKTVLSLLSTAVIIGFIWYRRNQDAILNERLQTVLDGLLRAEKKLPSVSESDVKKRPKVGVGFGGCYDVFLPAIETFHALDITPTDNRIHHDLVNSEEDLEQLFNYFFYHGAASERYVANQTLFNEMVGAAKTLKNSRWAVGGNAPVMANRLAMEGAEILLGSRTSPNVKFGDHVKGLTEQERDDIHVIMEYDKNEVWGGITTPRGNRLIVHNDQFNPLLNMIEEFEAEMKKFQPKLFVLGGLQMMDNFPYAEGVREKRLSVLKTFLSNTPSSTLIHFEMASFTEESLLKQLMAKVLPYSDSLGMNEQELPNILAMLNNKPVQLVADSNPRIATTLDDMRALFDVVEKLNGKRKLTRVHVHTLAYQAIITVKGSAWNNTMSAAAKASLVANRHVCGKSWINIENARLIMDDSFAASRAEGSVRITVKDDRPVSCWEEGDKLFCVAPNLVCTDIYQTGGGGDNISAAGLGSQITE